MQTIRDPKLAQLLLSCLLANVVVSEWDSAYDVWNNNLEQCQDGREEVLSYMPPIQFSSQLSSPEQAVANWSAGIRNWLDDLLLTGPCLPVNGSEEIDRVKSLVAEVEANVSTATQNITTATYDAYCLWSQILFKSGQGHLIVIPGYGKDSTLFQKLEDAQTVMRNAFHLWMNNEMCRALNTAQCEQEVNNSTLTTDDRDINVLCGNTVTEGSEECDDGNNISEDGCSATCKLEICLSSTSSPTVSIIPSTSDPTVAVQTPTPSPSPLVHQTNLSSCPDDCSSMSSYRRGTLHLSNFAVRASQIAVDTNTIKEMRNGLALLAQVMTILNHPEPSQSKIDSLQEQLAKTAIQALEQNDLSLITDEGVHIRMRLTGVCCESVDCCDSWTRLTWRPVHKWFRCRPTFGPGFDIGNLSTLGANIWGCMKLVLEQRLECSPGN
ncbi:uncharacterized protein LOC134196465 [Corticium candelabrum]|uniref:uncharacterized protein LOC134196465 n=1 Tax=Corticium candelabrum TaxID=121492 RepID=UPI002E2769A1|nr:uncharacterized protein LOC134196465 [Corticium candelabrum]